ncbi:surface lipoprotein assembly modifier [Methyloligella sp. 2.7D]|uniref:surface lipoprotein assembly modifier n=1 Tax=unclassified Methyloligella TaxID=2625955 RepID=UPI00157C9454|nr:surface lipoprotein assembly modifier [Methyloligella sp. GL2]QKP77444.1 DUF560 domain-containing protein [Methyloligella sp. GL2]
MPAAAAGSSNAEISRLTPEQLDARREALLEQMLERPNDLDLAFQYVELSEAAGDYEGAVTTLERMLIFSPNTPQLQLKTGLLYYKLGAYETSRSYLEQTLSNPATPPDVAKTVRLYLEQLSLSVEPAPFEAQIFSALRWESNANAGPASRTVTLNGLPFTIDEQSSGQSDWSSLNVGTVHYSYDRERQGDTFDFDFLAYSSTHFELSDVDLNVLEVTAGPSYNLRRFGVNNGRLYVYAIGDLTYLGGDYYFGAPGAGTRLYTFANERSLLDVRLETRYRDFQNSNELPTNSLWTGWQTRATTTYSYFLSPGVILTVEGQAQREAADADFYANWQIALTAGLAWSFESPLPNNRFPWTWQIGASVIAREYDAPDYTISTETEEDDTFWGRTALIIPVAETWSIIPQLEYRKQNSNYDIRNFDDLSTLVGIQKRF